MRPRLTLIVALILESVVLAGCMPPHYYLKPNPAYRFGPPTPGMAQVIFVNPMRYSGGSTTILEAPDARFIGHIDMGVAIARQIPPGEHYFVADAEGAHCMRLNVVAGKTYYVSVLGYPGAWTAVMRLFAVKRSMDDWRHLQEWLDDAERRGWLREVDVATGQAEVDRDREHALKLIERSRRTWAAYTQEDIFERTLGPDDGI